MKWSLFALCIGFCIDLLIGDPHGLPHPVAAIGHLISLILLTHPSFCSL